MNLTPWLAAGLLMCGTAVIAQPEQMESVPGNPAAIDGQTITDEVALKQDEAKRMTVDVSVGGKGPYRFLVDTGSERTVISRQLANRLHLGGSGTTMLHSVIGAKNVSTVDIPSLRVSTKTMSVDNAPALEAANIGADGMLGIDSLRAQRVLFDFRAGTMAITPSARYARPAEEDEIVVRARTRQGRLIFTEAKLDGQPVTVIIDTGSQITIGNVALGEAMERRRARIEPEPLTIQSVTGDTMQARVAMLKELDIGQGVGLHNVAVAFADAHIFRKLRLNKRPALLLGMNAMRAFDRISIDFAAKKVHFVVPETGMLDEVRMAELRRS